VLLRILCFVLGYRLVNQQQDNINVVSAKNGMMTSKSEINLQNFYVYNSSFGQKEGEVSVKTGLYDPCQQSNRTYCLRTNNNTQNNECTSFVLYTLDLVILNPCSLTDRAQ
jgi:hypothetical protein